MTDRRYCCWLCGSGDLSLIRQSSLRQKLTPENFQITDAHYGLTGNIYQCQKCTFKFCPSMKNVIDFYSAMEDDQYEKTRKERALQARKLLQLIGEYKSQGQLLDVGAGSGILVEEAQQAGYSSMGIEPSRSLAGVAESLGLPVKLGTLPLHELIGGCDVVTLIDVIEHVDNPKALLDSAVKHMKSDAVCIVVTPDVNSFFARILGYKWWHYRLAHIGYFDKHTLTRLAASAGLEVEAIKRPCWYFPLSYLVHRAYQYLPGILHFPVPAFLDRITVPLNLFDSLLFVCRKTHTPPQ